MTDENDVTIPEVSVETDETVSVSIYSDYVNKLEEKMIDFIDMAREGEGCKADALRARKLSLFLTDELPNFRKLSVKNDKGELDGDDSNLVAKER